MEQKVALVTGGSRGIGNAIACKLASDGYAVAATGTSDEKVVEQNLDAIRAEGQPFLYIRGNLRDRQDRTRTLEHVLNRFGRIDVLVNNAGVAPKKRLDIMETTEESYDFVMDTNLKAAFFLTQSVAKKMVEQSGKISGFKPKIINISSISAYTSSVLRGEYCISKAGVGMMTALFADRLAEYGIHVYEVRPGIIDTDMTAGVREKYDALISNGLTPIKRWGQPSDVADAVSVLCSGLLNFSTGEVINVDGGFHLRRL